MENKHNPKAREITDWIGNSRITWCGPFSVATVAGVKYEPAYQTLKMIRGKRHCKGVTKSNITKACQRFGVDPKYTALKKRRVLRKFIEDGHLESGKVYIVEVTKHVLVIDTRDWTTIDNQVAKWRAMDASHHWSKKLVKGFHEIRNPKFLPSDEGQLNFDFALAAGR